MFSSCSPVTPVGIPPTEKQGLMGYLMGWKGTSGYGSTNTALEVVGSVDSRGRVVVIVGGTAPIALELAYALLTRGAKVILGCRNVEAGNVEASKLQSAIPCADVSVMHCDLCTMEGAVSFAQDVKAAGHPLHALVLAASVSVPHFSLTKDGFEQHFAINHLAQCAVAQSLLPLLVDTTNADRTFASATSTSCSKDGGSTYGRVDFGSTARHGRIVMLSCAAHRISYTLSHHSNRSPGSWQVVSEGQKAGLTFMPAQAFGHSKLAQLLYVRELSQWLSQMGLPVTVNAVNPGVTQHGLNRYGGFTEETWIYSMKSALACGAQQMGMLKSNAQAAAPVAFAAVSPFMEKVSGSYVEDCRVSVPSSEACDPEAAAALWHYTQYAITQRLGENWPGLLAPAPQLGTLPVSCCSLEAVKSSELSS